MLAAGIYPTVLVDLGLVDALRSLARHCPVPTGVEADSNGRYESAIETAVYFCCSEAVQNAVKHAVGLTGISIHLERGDDLRFEVSDDGAGFVVDAGYTGHGLANMRARVLSVGGTLTLVSAAGQGTRVIGRVPLS